jgi:predicted transcriptional regulator
MKAEEFLEYFKNIEETINKLGSFNDGEIFSRKLDLLSEKNAMVRNYKEELKLFATLRNIYAHTPRGNYIADPTNVTLLRIKEIAYKLEHPILVKDKFIFELIGAKKEDHINEILKSMYAKSFSQFPIYDDGKVKELISTNTISRWLSANLEERGDILITDAKIKDFLSYIEFPQNYSFISKRTNVYDAFNKFKNQIKNNKRNLDVLFITENGSEKEDVIGLITIEDIAEFV